MIGVYIILAGAALIGLEIIDEIRKGGVHEKHHKNGRNCTDSNSVDGKRTGTKKHNRNRGVIAQKEGVTNESVVKQREPNPAGGRNGHDNAGQPDSSVSKDDQEQSIKGEPNEHKAAIDNGSCDDGHHVSGESVVGDASDNPETV